MASSVSTMTVSSNPTVATSFEDEYINDGEVYPHSIEGISGCFIYEIPPVSGDLYLVLFIHPLLPIEVFYDAWNRKYMYMDGTIGASVL